MRLNITNFKIIKLSKSMKEPFEICLFRQNRFQRKLSNSIGIVLHRSGKFSKALRLHLLLNYSFLFPSFYWQFTV